MRILYKMPDGTTRWYDEGKAPECAKPVKETKVEEKAVKEIENKAVSTAKNKKGSKK